jgi:hypothetical protein
VKKTALYLVVAVVLGLLLTLVPAVMLAEIKVESSYSWVYMGSKQLEEFRTQGVIGPKFSVGDLTILVFSFLVALAVYVLFKLRMPHGGYGLT